MKLSSLCLALFMFGCASMAPNYKPAIKWCKHHGGLAEGNPVFFSCNDGTKWRRIGHDTYEFAGNER